MKKILAMVLALSMVLALCACGSKAPTTTPEAPKPTEAPQKTEETTATEESKETEEAAPAAEETAWPEQPIEFIIPAKPGGDTDLTSRGLSASLTETLGKTVSVLNVAGGSGTIAIDEVLSRDVDGYSALYWHVDLILGSLLGRFEKNWTEMFDICAVPGGGSSTAIFVNSNSPWQTIEDLISDVKARPGEISIATETGASTHMLIVDMENKGGLEFNIVNIGGGADRATALLGGDVDVNVSVYGSCASYVESGDMRCLAVLADEPVEGLDAPTLKDATGIDTVWTHFYVVAFPKGTDPAIIEKMAAAIEKDAYTNNYTDVLAKYFFKADVKTGQAAMDYLNEAEAYFKTLVDQYNERYGT